VVVTDKLRSYSAAHRKVMPSVKHRSHKGLNNRAEHKARTGHTPVYRENLSNRRRHRRPPDPAG
jgi:transposase-like protein